jgi:hypothetical protein
MEILEILTDVARSRQELAALTDLDPARFHLCETVINSLENEIEHTVLSAWMPRTYPAIEGAILATMRNIAEVELLIEDAAPAVLVGKLPDEIIRFGVALLVLATLRLQLRTLFEAAAKLYSQIPMGQLN